MQRTVGTQLFLICEGKLLLMLRDDKPDIKDDPVNGIHFPNTWALPGGGVEEEEDFFQTAARELLEELGIEIQLQILGISSKGNGYFFAEIDPGLADQIVLGEGQDCFFYKPEELEGLKLGGAIGIYFDKYKDVVVKMIQTGKPAKGGELGLFIWNGGRPNDNH